MTNSFKQYSRWVVASFVTWAIQEILFTVGSKFHNSPIILELEALT